MDEIAKVFGLYDVTGYFVPGAVLLWAILEAYNAYIGQSGTASPSWRWRRAPKEDGWPRTGAFLLAAYIVGHMIQTVASEIDDEFYRYPEQHSIAAVYSDQKYMHFTDTLRTAVKLYRFEYNLFGDAPRSTIDKADLSDFAFTFCQIYAQNHHINAHTDMLLANRDLFRGLALSMAISFVAFLYAWRMDRKGRQLLFCIVLGVGSGLSLWRFEKFNQYWLDSVFRTCYIGELSPRRDVQQPTKAASRSATETPR